jgi:hypothetical protein
MVQFNHKMALGDDGIDSLQQFKDTTLCSLLKESQSSRRTCCLHLLALLATCFMLVSCLVYSLTLKMDATCSSEM